MSNRRYTFGDCVAHLRANGYAPAPLLDTDGHPPGPWRVAQTDYSRYDYAQCAAAVLTAVVLPRSERDPIQDPAATRLISVTLRLPEALAAKAARILKGKCLVRLAPDGALVHVFALDNNSVPFGCLNVQVEGVGSVNIDSHAAWIELGSPNDWRGGRDPLNQPRSSLPEIDQHEAVQLFNALHSLLHAHAPTPAAPAPWTPKPVLAPGERLLFQNTRAVNMLKRNGYSPRPVAWGKDTDEQGVAALTTEMDYGRLFHSAMSSTPGRSETWLATIELKAKRADIATALDAIFARHMEGASCPVRVASDGSTLRVFRWPQGVFNPVEFMRSAGAVGEFVPNGMVTMRIAVPESIVLSGLDGAGRPYSWRDGDLLSVKRDYLPELNSGKVAWIVRDIEKLLESSGQFRDESATQEAATAA